MTWKRTVNETALIEGAKQILRNALDEIENMEKPEASKDKGECCEHWGQEIDYKGKSQSVCYSEKIKRNK